MHKHDWTNPIAGTRYMGFFSWEWRTRILQTCKRCGKMKVRSIRGAWKNSGSTDNE